MLHRLKAYLRAPEAKTSRTAQVLAFESGGRARWTPRDYAALAREGYLGNAIVHRAVRLIAENAASCSYLVFEGAQEREGHPLAALLARPNPRQDGTTFLEALVSHLLLAGNAYVEAVALDDRVRELYALRPDRMKAVPGADGWAEAYEYVAGGRGVRFDQLASHVPPILHLTFFHPLDDHSGLAPPEAAAVPVDTHNTAARWNKALLDSAARPSGALVYSGPEGAVLSDAQVSTRAQSPTPIRARQCRASAAGAGLTGRRCRFKDILPRGQAHRGARDRAGVRRAADAARHSGDTPTRISKDRVWRQTCCAGERIRL